MPTKNSKTLSTRVSDNLETRFKREARLRDMTLANVIEAFVIASENDDIDIVDKGFYSKEPVDEYKDTLQRRYDRIGEKLTDKGYPREAILQMLEDIGNRVNDMPRYNPKRSRFSDTGC